MITKSTFFTLPFIFYNNNNHNKSLGQLPIITFLLLFRTIKYNNRSSNSCADEAEDDSHFIFIIFLFSIFSRDEEEMMQYSIQVNKEKFSREDKTH